ncbi:MAG TPA: TetR/AcrR family transcriptional regulator [Burkholderiaceae bacterium]
MAAPRETVENPLRKTPSQTRAMRTVDTLFEAATRVLQSEGEAGFTTNRIAERAGFSIGTLYQYFPSKEAIVVAMVRRQRERVMRELDAMLERAVAGEIGGEEALRLYLKQVIDAFGRGQKAQRLLARLGWQLDAPALIVAAMDDAAQAIRSALERLGDPALPVPDDATLYLLTRAVLGAVRSAAVEEHGMLDDPRFEEALFRMVCGVLFRPADAG